MNDFIRPHDPNTDLTPAQIAFINEKKLCPFCRKGELLEGPIGGMCQNFRCERRCGREMNLGLFNGRIVSGHTIDRNEPSLYERLTLSEKQHPFG